jgi:hypothetical protein
MTRDKGITNVTPSNADKALPGLSKLGKRTYKR